MSNKSPEKNQKLSVTDFPYVEITVRVYNTSPNERFGGNGLLTFHTFTTDVVEDGEIIGGIGGGVGSVVIMLESPDLLKDAFLQIRHRDIWYAIQEAIKKGEWKWNNPPTP